MDHLLIPSIVMARVKRQQLQLFRALFDKSAGAWTPEIEMACLDAFTNNLCLDLMGDQIVALMFVQNTPSLTDLQSALQCIPSERWAGAHQVVSYWTPTWNHMTAQCVETLMNSGCRISECFQALGILLASSDPKHHSLVYPYFNINPVAGTFNGKLIFHAAQMGHRGAWNYLNINDIWEKNPKMATSIAVNVFSGFGSAKYGPIQEYLSQTMCDPLRTQIIEFNVRSIEESMKKENVAHHTHLNSFTKRLIEEVTQNLDALLAGCDDNEQAKWFKYCNSKGLPVPSVVLSTHQRLNLHKHVGQITSLDDMPAPRKKM